MNIITSLGHGLQLPSFLIDVASALLRQRGLRFAPLSNASGRTLTVPAHLPGLPVPGINKTKPGANNKLALDKKRLQVALSVAMQEAAQKAPPPGEAIPRMSAVDLAAVRKRVSGSMSVRY